MHSLFPNPPPCTVRRAWTSSRLFHDFLSEKTWKTGVRYTDIRTSSTLNNLRICRKLGCRKFGRQSFDVENLVLENLDVENLEVWNLNAKNGDVEIWMPSRKIGCPKIDWRYRPPQRRIRSNKTRAHNAHQTFCLFGRARCKVLKLIQITSKERKNTSDHLWSPTIGLVLLFACVSSHFVESDFWSGIRLDTWILLLELLLIASRRKRHFDNYWMCLRECLCGAGVPIRNLTSRTRWMAVLTLSNWTVPNWAGQTEKVFNFCCF